MQLRPDTIVGSIDQIQEAVANGQRALKFSSIGRNLDTGMGRAYQLTNEQYATNESVDQCLLNLKNQEEDNDQIVEVQPPKQVKLVQQLNDSSDGDKSSDRRRDHGFNEDKDKKIGNQDFQKNIYENLAQSMNVNLKDRVIM